MSGDPHTPTTAGPTPEPDPEPAAAVPPSEGSWKQPAGTAVPSGLEEEGPKPEVLLGAAFAGGFVAAMILKRFGRNR